MYFVDSKLMSLLKLVIALDTKMSSLIIFPTSRIQFQRKVCQCGKDRRAVSRISFANAVCSKHFVCAFKRYCIVEGERTDSFILTWSYLYSKYYFISSFNIKRLFKFKAFLSDEHEPTYKVSNKNTLQNTNFLVDTLLLWLHYIKGVFIFGWQHNWVS